ncbi:MAG: Holliday junction branch migration protein RuvA [Myxococcales bacterium]|nr:Holliday junction branch migration protein RuvA [Myxococcales bacterium]
MIARLRGTVVAKTVDSVTVDVGGVGYRVFVPMLAMSQLLVGEAVELQIHTHVREDALLLYGFPTDDEKSLFRLLIAVSGIGPKQALNIMGGMEADELVGALRRDDLKALSRIPGVGKKTAERLCYELRDKVTNLAALPSPKAGASPSALLDDLLSALVNLGYKPKLVDDAITALANDGVSGDFQTLLREALKRLR